MRFTCAAVLVLVGVLVTSQVDRSTAKVYTKCGLKNELEKRNFSRTLLGNWLCMIQSESRRNTSAETVQPNRTKNLGLFQINDKEWCTYNKKGGKCNLKCEDLLDENIDDDAVCAQKYREENGFKIWRGWNRYCYNNSEATKVSPC